MRHPTLVMQLGMWGAAGCRALSFGEGPKNQSWPEATPPILVASFYSALIIDYTVLELSNSIANT